jgi:hypothetical protein
MKKLIYPGIASLILFFCSCKKDDETPVNNPTTGSDQRYVIFKFHFDSTQVRLDNLGNPSTVPAGHSAQCPVFNKMCAHYVELTPTMYDSLGKGQVVYRAAETSVGGSKAIDHSLSVIKGEGEEFLRVPVTSIAAGSYNYLRVSLAYQNYDIKYKYVYNSVPYYLTGTIASFIGYKTYINNYTIKTQSVAPSSSVGGAGNHLQGYWGFETTAFGITSTIDGQAPPGATTVPNPIFATSPIPQGSCLVTGQFASPLVITGSETADIIVNVSLSTNKSFEWKDANMDGQYEPAAGDTVVDMGVRGLIPIKQ